MARAAMLDVLVLNVATSVPVALPLMTFTVGKLETDALPVFSTLTRMLLKV